MEMVPRKDLDDALDVLRRIAEMPEYTYLPRTLSLSVQYDSAVNLARAFIATRPKEVQEQLRQGAQDA